MVFALYIDCVRQNAQYTFTLDRSCCVINSVSQPIHPTRCCTFINILPTEQLCRLYQLDESGHVELLNVDNHLGTTQCYVFQSTQLYHIKD